MLCVLAKKVSLLWIELFCWVFGIVHKEGSCLKVFPISLPKSVYLVKQVFGTKCVQESERTTSKRREPETKDSTDVPVKRAVEDSILETPNCLIDEARGNTELHFLYVMAVGGRKGK